MVPNIKTSVWNNWRVMARSMPQTKANDLRLADLSWLAIGILLSGTPHWERLPIWIPVLHLILLFTRLYLPYQFPKFWHTHANGINLIRLLIMIGGVFGVYLSFGTLAGRDVGIALLVLLAGLKVFESKYERDFYITAYLGYFLVITNFFYSQTIPTAIYMFFVIIIMTACLVNFNDTERHLSLSERFKFSTLLMLQSIPLLLVLFILFPRVQGPLWGLPEDAYTGITGIDDQMTPGTISKLVESNEVAFRVTFENEIPEQSNLYWRGPVLWQTDGRKWTPGNRYTHDRPANIQFNGNEYNYDVILEPTNKKWLFGLEMIASIPEKSRLTHDYQLKSIEPVRARRAFKLTSYSDFYFGKNADEELEPGLILPETSHSQTKEFGLALRQQYQQPQQIINAALDWLQKESFVYTLRPPLITGDSVDEFLFNTRSGFCEHYAAAFTVLMRSAGIPARVVTGYLGG